jgi:hypothetical protein
MNTFEGGISCQVSGASSAETGFTVTFSTNEAVCHGSLTRGSGSCEVSFSISEPFSVGTVAGELLPSHRPLGPVQPALAP